MAIEHFKSVQTTSFSTATPTVPYFLQLDIIPDPTLYFGDDGIVINNVSGPFHLTRDGKDYYELDISDWHRTFRNGGVVSIGIMGSLRRGLYQIHLAVKDTGRFVVKALENAPAPQVGDKIYTKHQYAVGATLNYLFAQLGGAGSSGLARAAFLFLPPNAFPATPTWANMERFAIWSRIYPASATVNVEFPSLEVYKAGFLPLDKAQNDVVPSLYFAVFDEQNLTLANEFSVQVTYQYNSLIDYNAL